MSNRLTKDEAIELFKAGKVEEWNQWRQKASICQSQDDLKNALDARKIDLSRTDFSGQKLDNINLMYCQLDSSKFIGTSLRGANFDHANCTEACFDNADLTGSTLTRIIVDKASFVGTKLVKANLSDTNCEGTDFTGADFTQSTISGTLLNATLSNCRGLFGRNHGIINEKSERHIETIKFFSNDLVDWERIRFLGSFPFFGVSNIAIVLIITYAHFARWWNEQLYAIHAQLTEHPIVDQWIMHLKHLPIPAHFGRLLAAFMLLFIGSSIFKLFCPPIVKEYNQTRWEIELDKSKIEYRSAMYSHFRLRYICSICYAIGGGYVFSYLAWQVIKTLYFICTN